MSQYHLLQSRLFICAADAIHYCICIATILLLKTSLRVHLRASSSFSASFTSIQMWNKRLSPINRSSQ